MKITIIGNGNIGSGLASVLAQAGHEVSALDRNDDIASAVAGAETVILATPYGAAAELAGQADFSGKVVIDVSKPVNADFSGLQVGHTSSAAEEIASLLPGSKVVKAFNTIFAQVLQNGGQAAGRPATVFVAGDDEAARAAVAELARSAGFETLETGALATARYLEPTAALNITLGYGLGHGTDIAPTWQRAA